MSSMRISLNARRPDALADFYVRALGFERGPIGAGGVMVVLGETCVDIVGCDGQAYPASVPGWSLLFQHFAITTTDMVASMTRLNVVAGWAAISQGGPQRLPANTGGVTAFKFRDPEGHPIELIAFPNQAAGTPPRIDHSAISVANTQTSIAFYEQLGLTVGGRSLNQGVEQDRLDGLDGVEVEVTALNLPGGGPHVELLCYRGDYLRAGPAEPDDVAATRLTWLVSSELQSLANAIPGQVVNNDLTVGPLLIRDPDGHLLQLSTHAGHSGNAGLKSQDR